MEILIVYNPSAGRGRGESTAVELARALEEAGHTVRRRSAGPARSEPGRCGPVPGVQSLSYDPSFGQTPAPAPAPAASVSAPATVGRADLVLVVGGDGTLHYTLDELAPRRAAVHHVPMGTENLFARQFGMQRETSAVLEAVKAWRLRDIDLPRCRGRRFALMCSIGPDAGVVHRLAAARDGAITHRSYMKPILKELLRPALPRLHITLDGQPWTTGARGMAVVANCNPYALRIDPARRADPADGQLDVVFIPARSSLALLTKLASLRTIGRGPGVRRARARRVRMEAEGPTIRAQIDGEPAFEASAGKMELNFEVEPGALRVLVGIDHDTEPPKLR